MLDVGRRSDKDNIPGRMPLAGRVVAMAVGAQAVLAAGAVMIARSRVVIDTLMDGRGLRRAGSGVGHGRKDKSGDDQGQRSQ